MYDGQRLPVSVFFFFFFFKLQTIAMFPSPCFYAQFEVSHQKQVMNMANFKRKKNPSKTFKIHKKKLHSLEVVFDFNANNGRWKCICRINSSMCIKKVMWLCAMGRNNLTNQWTDLVAQHLKCCFGHSEMPEQSLSSKYFGIIASQNCFTWLHSQTAMTTFIVFRLLALRHK